MCRNFCDVALAPALLFQPPDPRGEALGLTRSVYVEAGSDHVVSDHYSDDDEREELHHPGMVFPADRRLRNGDGTRSTRFRPQPSQKSSGRTRACSSRSARVQPGLCTFGGGTLNRIGPGPPQPQVGQPTGPCPRSSLLRRCASPTLNSYSMTTR